MLYRREIVDALVSSAADPAATWNVELLSLISALARDTQLEFAPLFDNALANTLVSLLDTTSAPMLEALFQCWGFLFKYLQRHFSVHIVDLFLRIENLFAHRREHVRRFIAQGFAFLVRKLPRGDDLLDDDDDHNDNNGKRDDKASGGAMQLIDFFRFLRQRVALNANVGVGVGHLLFETWCGTAKRFHSRAADLLSVALEAARDEPDADADELVAWRASLDEAFSLSMSHGRAEPANAALFLAGLCGELDIAAKRGAAANANGTWLPLALGAWCRKKQQRFLTNPDAIANKLVGKNGALAVGVLSAQWQSVERVDASLLLARTLLIGSEARDSSRPGVAKSQDHVMNALMPSLASTVVRRESVLSSVLAFLKTAHDVLGEDRIRRAIVQHVRVAVVTLGALMAGAHESLTLLHWLAAVVPYLGGDGAPLDGLEPALQCALTALRTPLGASSSMRDIVLVHAGLRCHALARCASQSQSRGGSNFLTLLCATVDRVVELLGDEQTPASQRAVLAPLLDEALAACDALVPSQDELRSLLAPRLDAFLAVIEQTSAPREPTTLRSLALAFETAVAAGCEWSTDEERVAQLVSLLAPELSRSTPMARMSAARCVSALIRLSDGESAHGDIFDTLVLLHTKTFDHTTARIGTVKLRSIDVVLRDVNAPVPVREAALHGVFGVYFVRFAEFWPIATDLLVSAAHADINLFWRIVWPLVQKVESDALTSVDQVLALNDNSDDKQLRHVVDEYAESVVVRDNRTTADVFVKEVWAMLVKVGAPLSAKVGDISEFILRFGEQVHVLLRAAFNRDLAGAVVPDADDNDDRDDDDDDDAGGDEAETKSAVVVDNDDGGDDENGDDKDGNVDGDDDDDRNSALALVPATIKQLGRVALCKSLELLATFRNVRTVPRRDELCELLMRYLSRPETDLQLAALKCLLLFKPRSFAQIAEPLHFLVSASLRTALFEWRHKLDRSTGLVPADDRDEVTSLMCRLLIGRVLALKGGRRRKYHDIATRSLVFGFVGTLEMAECAKFVELLFAPFAGAFTGVLAADAVAEERCDAALRAVPRAERELVVELLRQIFKALASLVSERFGYFGSLLLGLLRVSVRRKFAESRRRTLQYRFLADCHTRMRELMVRFADHGDLPSLVHRWFELTTPDALERSAHQGWAQFRCVLLLSQSAPLVTEFLTTSHAQALVRAAVMTLGSSRSNAAHRSDVLELFENLLKATQVDDAALDALQPHVSLLLAMLRSAVANRDDVVLPADMRMSQGRVRQLTARFARRQLLMLSRIAAFVSDEADAVPLLELLLPFLRGGDVRGSAAAVLDTIALLLPCVPAASVQQFALSTQALFSQLEWTRPARDGLTRCFTAAAATNAVPSLSGVAPLLVRLNAFSDDRLDESNYEVQSAALRELSEPESCELIAAMPRFALLPVLHTLLQLMRTDSMSLRVAAAACVGEFVRALAKPADRAVRLDVAGEFAYGGDEWLAARFDAAHGLVFGAVLDALRHRPMIVRAGFQRVLGALVEHWPAEYGDMSTLCQPVSATSDANFFEAIAGSQSQQTLALAALASGAKQWLPERITSLFVPVLHRMMLDADAKRNDHIGAQLLRTLATLAARLDWPLYLTVLRRMLDAAASDPAHQSILMSAVCTLLDSFRFDARLGESLQPAPTGTVEGSAVAVVDEAPKFAHNDVQAGMLESVLPMLYSLLGSKRVMRAAVVTSGKLRAGGKRDVQDEARGQAFVAIAEATVKVLVLMPPALLSAELPMLLTRLVSRLSDREFEAREAARSALCGLCATIGPKCMPQVVHELRTSLLRGYQQHVLGYTLHSILLRLQQQGATTPGQIDPAIEDIVTILLDNIIGRVAAEKEVSAVANATREAKANRALPAFRLLAEMIDFERSVVTLLEPIVSVMGETDSARVQNRAAEMLNEIRHGLLANPSMSVRALLLFVHGHVGSIGAKAREEHDEEQRRHDDAARAARDVPPVVPTGLLRDRLKRAAEFDTFLLPPDPRREAQKAPHAKRHTRLQLARMALGLFQDAIHRRKLGTATEKQRALLEVFIPSLADAFRSSDNVVVTMAMSCLSTLIERGVARDGAVVARLLRRTLALIDRLPSRAPLVGDALRLLTTVIQFGGDVLALDGAQMSALARFIAIEIESLTRMKTTFALLRAVLRRKLPMAEIYALMETVSQLAVRAEDEQMRRPARFVFIDFLASYPLADKAFSDHLAFIVTNMRQHEFESGRLSCIEMMMLACEKLPPQLVSERAEFFFLPLVASLVGDDFPRCRAAAAEAVRVLLLRIDAQRVGSLLSVALNWFGGGGTADNYNDDVDAAVLVNPKRDRLRATGAQTLRLFGGGVLSDELEASTLTTMARALRRVVAGLPEIMVENTASAQSVAAVEQQWPWLYHALVALERFVTAPRDSLLAQLRAGGPLHDIWSLASEFLLYPHAWVRRVSCRLVGCCLAQRALDDGGFASGPADALRLIDALCAQLDSPHLSDEHGEQVVKNLLVLMRRALALGDAIDALVDEASARRGSALRAEVVANGDTKVQASATTDEGDEGDESDEGDEGDVDDVAADIGERVTLPTTSNGAVAVEYSKTLRWVFVRTSYIARRGNSVQKTTVFKLFAAAVLQLGNDAVQPHLEPIIVPLHREQTSAQQSRRRKATALAPAHVVGDLANEVIGLLQTHVDAFAFADAFHSVAKGVASRASARKLARETQDVMEPERAAKRRAVKQERKRRRNRAEAQARRLREVKFDARVRETKDGDVD